MTASLILAILYVLTCVWLISFMVRQKTLIAVHLGVLAIFSLGYYPLPVLFKPLSSLNQISDEKVFYALLIHYLFLLCLIGGALWATRYARLVPVMTFGPLDQILFRNRALIAWICFGTYILYVLTTPQTSYAAEDFDAYFEKKSAFRSILAAVASFCLAFICLSYALAAMRGHLRGQVIYGVMIVCIVLLALPLGQRLAAISPIILLFAALASMQQTTKALRILGLAVVFLLIVSPFAVYLREARRAQTGDFLSASEVVGQYQVSTNPLTQSFQSILDRSDLVFNTIFMKEFIDRTEYANWQYYYSVLVSPIPRIFYSNKPYVLSTDGTIDGEISVKAWRLTFGSLGSLTAFGGLTAYREGGWIGVVLDGLADGVLFALLARWLGYGSIVARVFYIDLFLLMAVQKVPPCFFEALAGVLGHVPLILGVAALAMLPLYRRGGPQERATEMPQIEGAEGMV